MLRVNLRWLIGVLLTCVATAHAAEEAPREYHIKAAFIYNFTQFVEWPGTAFNAADAPFLVAVVGQDPFAGALEQVFSGKSVNSRKVVDRHYASVNELGPCHVLIVPASDQQSAKDVLRKIAGGAPVLTVGDDDNFLDAGGCIRFYLQDKRIRFEVNVETTDQCQLKLSSKLLKLARIYRK